jgi:hypothetical protein
MYKKTKTLLSVIAIDGIATTKTGVGNVVFNFFDAFKDITRSTWFDSRNVTLMALTPKILSPGDDINDSRLQFVTEVCEAQNGYVDQFSSFSMSNLQADLWTGGEIDTLTKWQSMALAAASKLDQLARQFDEVIAIAHDTPFCLVRNYLQSQNVKIIWMSHGLGNTFDDEWKTQRVRAENMGVPALMTHQDFFACISEEVKQELIQHYGIPNHQLLNMTNEYHPIASCPDQTAMERLDTIKQRSYGKKVIFAWGRCCYQKGYDVLVPAISQFLKSHQSKEYYVVLLMPTGTGGQEYEEKVLAQAQQIPTEDFHFITEFDEFLPKLMLESLRVLFPAACGVK